jgi:hypothetical protein
MRVLGVPGRGEIPAAGVLDSRGLSRSLWLRGRGRRGPQRLPAPWGGEIGRPAQNTASRERESMNQRRINRENGDGTC